MNTWFGEREGNGMGFLFSFCFFKIVQGLSRDMGLGSLCVDIPASGSKVVVYYCCIP